MRQIGGRGPVWRVVRLRDMDAPADAIRIISFDAEGTLASHAFSRTIWQEAVPSLYGARQGLAYEDAAARVYAEYATIGPDRREWYDIGYWFERLGLGEPEPVIESHRALIELYPDVRPALEALDGRYQLVVASSTPLEFLRPLLRDVESSFTHVFSSTSACGRLKDADFFRWVAVQLGVTPSQIVHVGDHLVRDYESARGAGMVAFHIDRCGRSDASIRSLAELVDLLPMRETGRHVTD
jgi:5'-nucleotidase